MTRRHFEDFAVGEVLTFGSKRVTRAEIIAFAAEFDPQPYHLDEHAGGAGDLAGGLIASGWHSCAMYMRMLCDGMLLDSACLGSPGVETLKWLKPVRAGDQLSGRVTVLEARLLRSRPDMGLVRVRHELLNAAGETLMWFDNPVLFERRGTAA
jgi:acyl dehydratase